MLLLCFFDQIVSTCCGVFNVFLFKCFRFSVFLWFSGDDQFSQHSMLFLRPHEVAPLGFANRLWLLFYHVFMFSLSKKVSNKAAALAVETLLAELSEVPALRKGSLLISRGDHYSLDPGVLMVKLLVRWFGRGSRPWSCCSDPKP